MTITTARFLILGLIPFSVTACGARSPVAPSAPAVATMRVGTESFRVLLPTDELVAAARAAMGGGSSRILNGVIRLGTQVNTGYSWHLEELSFAEVAIELCDGTPSMVEQQGTAFGAGRFCPWNARVVSITPN